MTVENGAVATSILLGHEIRQRSSLQLRLAARNRTIFRLAVALFVSVFVSLVLTIKLIDARHAARIASGEILLDR